MFTIIRYGPGLIYRHTFADGYSRCIDCGCKRKEARRAHLKAKGIRLKSPKEISGG